MWQFYYKIMIIPDVKSYKMTLKKYYSFRIIYLALEKNNLISSIGIIEVNGWLNRVLKIARPLYAFRLATN